MRNPERLSKLYEELAEIHRKSFPDMRFCQYWLNVMGYINGQKDPFFVEDDKIVEFAKRYANENSMWFKGWDLSVYKSTKVQK